MSNVFNINPRDDDDEDISTRINMDELYEQKQKQDLHKVDTYNKLLARIHVKIKTTSRQRTDNQWCWYLMPEVLIGSPNYNFSDCLSYIMFQLQDNGFIVKYTHPNLIFISWKHWVPDYVRDEIKQKTGVVVDGYGKVISKKNKDENILLMNNKKKTKPKLDTNFKSTTASVYSKDLLNRILDK